MESRWVMDLGGEKFMEMVRVGGGKFIKGEVEEYLGEYWISRYLVTNGQFRHFIEETGYSSSDSDFLQHWDEGRRGPQEGILDHPVVYVNWDDCMAFCRAYGLTLPTEAQWQKAARGSDSRKYPWGDEDPSWSDVRCNIRNIFGGTTPVGLFDGSREGYRRGSSPYGVEDMLGNVWEWCLDEWDDSGRWEKLENYRRAKREGMRLEEVKSLLVMERGKGEGGKPIKFRVVRGGAWDMHYGDIDVLLRGFDGSRSCDDEGGFRCCYQSF